MSAPILLAYTVRDTDVWLNFKSAAGAEASISVAALAERSGPVVGRALRAWAGDTIARASLHEPMPQTVLLVAQPVTGDLGR